MTYEETKRVMMASFPSLFVNEIDVLSQLFFVNGNGFDWEHGELVDSGAQKELLSDAEIKAAVEKELERRQFYLDNPILNRDGFYFLLADGTIGKQLYPLCQYADILGVPFDAKPDWVAAAKRAIEVAPTHFRCTDRDTRWLAIAAKRLAIIEAQDAEAFAALEASERDCAKCYATFVGGTCPNCEQAE